LQVEKFAGGMASGTGPMKMTGKRGVRSWPAGVSITPRFLAAPGMTGPWKQAASTSCQKVKASSEYGAMR